jgi:hypothetical protein
VIVAVIALAAAFAGLFFVGWRRGRNASRRCTRRQRHHDSAPVVQVASPQRSEKPR